MTRLNINSVLNSIHACIYEWTKSNNNNNNVRVGNKSL